MSEKSDIDVRKLTYDLVKFVFIALLIITPFRFYVAQPFIVSGASMIPTLHQGEYLVIDELSYRFDTPKRGDVVIFRYPLDPAIFFIKRVVGLPGERVEVKSGIVFIQGPGDSLGARLDEPYRTSLKDNHADISIKLDEHEYFMLGDNRDASSDSRTWGPVHDRFIVGRAFMRLFPFSKAEMLPGKWEY
jgi:signal peptidase I